MSRSIKKGPYVESALMKRIEEMLEVYYNSGQFEIAMKVLNCCYESAFDMFQRLGDFYEEKAYDKMSHSRIRRCEILLEFAENIVVAYGTGEEMPGLREVLREALIFDLYSRENCKSRPAWAYDMGSFKHMTHHYCKKGKLSHVEPFHYDFMAMKDRLPERKTATMWVLYSYERRNPLTHCAEVAMVEYITPEENKNK